MSNGNKSWGLLGVLVIVGVLLLGNLILTLQTSDNVDQLTTVAEESRDAAKKASDDLSAAIEQSSGSETQQAFLQLVETVKRLEIELCGGPCEPTPEE